MNKYPINIDLSQGVLSSNEGVNNILGKFLVWGLRSSGWLFVLRPWGYSGMRRMVQVQSHKFVIPRVVYSNGMGARVRAAAGSTILRGARGLVWTEAHFYFLHISSQTIPSEKIISLFRKRGRFFALRSSNLNPIWKYWNNISI